MEKTISHLNSKTLYRLIKVIYFLLFTVALTIYNTIVFNDIGFKNINLDKTTIQCNLTDKKLLNLNNAQIYPSTNDFVASKFDYKYYFTGHNDDDIKKILNACYGDSDVNLQISVYDQQKRVEIVNKYGLIGKEKTKEDLQKFNKDYNEYKQKTENIYTENEKAKYLDFSVHFFDINPVFTFTRFIEYLLIGNISILLFAELLRRTFYYIITGTLRPKK